MSQAIKYESTSIEPNQSAGEIAGLVAKYGGTRFEMRWGDYGELTGVRFAIRHARMDEVPVRLTAAIDNVAAIIMDRRPYTSRTRGTRQEWERKCRETAARVAWRQLRDFVEQSLLAVETGLFPLHEVFMAQVETRDPETGEVVTVGELFDRHAALAPTADGSILLIGGGS